MINRVTLTGRITKDLELRKTPNGKSTCTFTIAVNRVGTDDTDYLTIVTWNKVAENISRYCSKGSLVGVDGRLHSRSYDNNEGNRVYVTEVVAESVYFLETKH